MITSAVASMYGGEVKKIHLALFHGANWPLILSGLSFAVALAVYMFWDELRKGRFLRSFRTLFGWAPDRGYDYAIEGLKGTAYWQTRFLQSGILRHYLVIMFSTFLALVGTSLLAKSALLSHLQVLDPETIQTGITTIHFYEWMIFALMVSGAFAAAWARTKLAAIISLGIAGFSVAMFYMLFSAPDLAITQILVETLTVVLIALVMLYLPATPEDRGITGRRFRDMMLAGGSGLVVTLLLMSILTLDFDPQLQQFFAANSYSEAHGLNIVNVILVDFRAFDTLGEITVLGTAAIGVYALIKLVPPEEKSDESGEEPSS
jgi:multicomponent Na+:H+ antiporter subunit A